LVLNIDYFGFEIFNFILSCIHLFLLQPCIDLSPL
jgi:hypothetical protein